MARLGACKDEAQVLDVGSFPADWMVVALETKEEHRFLWGPASHRTSCCPA